MKKKSIAARLGVAAMALTLVTASLTSGTLAKYTSRFQATASLEVANWNVAAEILGTGGAKTVMVDEGTLNNVTLASTAYAEADGGIKPGRVSGTKLAPGMAGQFDIQLYTAGVGKTTASDVDVEYDVYIDVTNGTAPGNFTFKDITGGGSGTTVTLSGNKDSDYGYQITHGYTKAGDTGADASPKRTIKWEWPYETNAVDGVADVNEDKEDTSAGKAHGNVQYKVTVVFTQANPTEARPA